jgi:ligand-binding sensor domain-containing protein
MILATLAGVAAAEPLEAERWSRLFTSGEGLPSTASQRVVQDDRGFVWVSTMEGLARLDGAHVTPIPAPRAWLVYGSGSGDRVIAQTAHHLSEVVDDRLVPVPAPIEVGTATVDDRGRIWVSTDSALYVETAPRGPWRRVDLPAGDVRQLGPGLDGALLVAVSGAVLEVGDHGWSRLADDPGVFRAIERADWTVYAIGNLAVHDNNHGAVFEIAGGRARLRFESPYRVIDLSAGRDDVYVQFDTFSVRLGPGGASERL